MGSAGLGPPVGAKAGLDSFPAYVCMLWAVLYNFAGVLMVRKRKRATQAGYTAMNDVPALRVTIEVGGVEYRLSPSDDAEINPADLDFEFTHTPAVRSKWSQLAGRLAVELERLEYEKKKLYAAIDAETREAGLASGVKMTEKMVENQTITDARYQEHMAKIFEHKQALKDAAAAVDGQADKLTSLVSLGAQERQFGPAGSGPRLNELPDGKETAIRKIRETKAKKKIRN